MTDADVVVIGAGPVGLTLAGELGRAGRRVLVLEKRATFTTHPKATLLGSRSMEYLRRWGITDEIYAAALPNDHPYYIVFTTALAGYELYRVQSPSIRETIERRPETVERFRELSWSPYSKTQIGQQALEPVLSRHVGAMDGVDLRYEHEVLDYSQDDDGVTLRVRHTSTGRVSVYSAAYVVGCDGADSLVRRRMGSRYNGRGRMRRNVSFFFRSREFLRRQDKGVANLYFVFNPPVFGVFTAIDAHELWNFQYYFLDDPGGHADIDPQAVLSRAFGAPLDFELLNVEHWYHNQSVATCWRDRRAFLAGDSAHLFVPTGGVGMNTGIGDAVDLAWKLDAVLAGWGGPWLLDSYEAERKPVAIRNSIVSANNSDKIDIVMRETPEYIDEGSARGASARRVVREKIRWLAQQFSSAGLHLGYRYRLSPICVPDTALEPPDDPSQLTPSTWPGMRFPHCWTDATTSTLDRFQAGFALVSCGGRAQECAALVTALRKLGAPCQVVQLESLPDDVRGRYVLVRPDGHVAWRGEGPPVSPESVAQTVAGHALPVHLTPREDK